MGAGGAERTRGNGQPVKASPGSTDVHASVPGAGVTQLKQLVGRGVPSARAVAQIMAAHPSDQREMLDLLHRTAGNAFVQQVLGVLRTGAGPASLENEITEVKLGLDLDALVRKTLLPAYRRAVDALDPNAALELAMHIVSAVRAAQHGDADAASAMRPGIGAAQVSTPGAPIDDTPQAASARWAELSALHGALSAELVALMQELAVQLGPQTFKNKAVMGTTAVPPLGKDPSELLASEAGTVVSLLSVVRQAQVISGAADGTCAPLEDVQRRQIAALIEPWHARPINYAFLAAALRDLGIWDDIAAAKGPSGRSLQATMTKAQTQAKATGALADVGEFDAEEAERLLPGTPEDKAVMKLQHRGDDSADKIFDRIRTAAPDARGPILRQLAAMDRLDVLCQHLPWQQVKALHDAVAPLDRSAATLLTPYFDGKGGGESMHQIYMDKVDDRLQAGHEVRAFGWFFLDFLHNALTGGFEHEYSAAYDAHEQGWITDDEYSSQTTKALGKAALITAVSALTGGVAGEFAQGVAAPLGEGAASVIGGGVGGFAGGVSGHFAGDVYDQLLNGKQGFDSVGDYMKSGALGGGIGASAAMLTSLSIAGARYLRPEAVDGSLKRTADVYAERHPAMTRILEAGRRAGINTRITIQAKVSEVLELIDSHLGGPGGPTSLAVVGGGDLRSLPKDAEVRLSFHPAEDLNRPMTMSGKKTEDGRGVGSRGKAPSNIEGTGRPRPIEIDRVEPASQMEGSTLNGSTPADAAATSSPQQAAGETRPDVATRSTPNELKLGRQLGSGGEKDVFAVEGRDDIVIGIAKSDVTMERLAAEAAQLKTLGELGIPVVEIEAITEYQGRPALIMRRYALGSKTVARTIKGRVKLVGRSDLLNARSVQDLEGIRTALKNTPVWINDLQFLIGEDGAVVVADVLDFKIGQEPSKANLSTIDRLIEAARDAIARKGSAQ